MNTPKSNFIYDNLTVLSRPEYFHKLTEMISKTRAGEHVLVTTMSYQPTDPLIADLIAALNAAALRKVHVNLLVDSYNFLINPITKVPGPLWFNTDFDKQWRRHTYHTMRQTLHTLATNGGHFTVTNQPSRALMLPQANRSHIKAAVVNDHLYIGGCNLELPHEIDLMVELQDKPAADWLYNLLYRVSQTGNVRKTLQDKDQAFQINEKIELLIDAGVPKQSIIFDRALTMIDEAKEWIVLTSQYFAPGPSLQALLRALQRGVKIVFYYSHPSMHGPVEGTAHRIYQRRQKRYLPAELFAHQLPKDLHLHAKLLATEKGAIIGSHNYAQLGVNLGTAESALLCYSPVFSKDAVKFIEKQLKLHA